MSFRIHRGQSSEANEIRIIKLRLAHYSEVVGSTDLLFGMQESIMSLVETLEFQNTQRSEDSFSFIAQNKRLAHN